jgi:hypothetical protein
MNSARLRTCHRSANDQRRRRPSIGFSDASRGQGHHHLVRDHRAVRATSSGLAEARGCASSRSQPKRELRFIALQQEAYELCVPEPCSTIRASPRHARRPNRRAANRPLAHVQVPCPSELAHNVRSAHPVRLPRSSARCIAPRRSPPPVDVSSLPEQCLRNK